MCQASRLQVRDPHDCDHAPVIDHMFFRVLVASPDKVVFGSSRLLDRACMAGMTRSRVRQESWQRIGGASPPRGRSSQPPRPRVMHEVLSARIAREAFTGETTGRVLSCETGLIPRCRSSSLTRRQHLPWAYWLAWAEPRAVEGLAHVVKFFVRNLGGLTRARTCSGPAREGRSRTPSMYADEKSDEAVVPRKRRTKEGNFRRRSWREGPHPRGTADRAAVVRTLSRATMSIRLAAVRRCVCGFKPCVAHVRPEGGDPMQVRRAG